MALDSPATIPNIEGANKENLAIDVLQSQLHDMKRMIEISMIEGKRGRNKGSISVVEYERISNQLDRLINSRRKMHPEELDSSFSKLMMETEELSMHSSDSYDHNMFRYLMERIHKAHRELK